MGKNIVEQNKQDVKDKSKKEKHTMKTTIDWKTVKTVTITLVSVAALFGMFLLGMKYESSQDARVKAEAATIVKNVKVEVSKQ